MATIGSGAWSQGAITDGDEPGLVPLMVERATEDVGVTPFDIQMQKGSEATSGPEGQGGRNCPHGLY